MARGLIAFGPVERQPIGTGSVVESTVDFMAEMQEKESKR